MESIEKTFRSSLLLALLFCGCVLSAHAQRVRGELHIEVRDPQGATLAVDAELSSEVNQFRRTFGVGSDGRYVVEDLAFGVYKLTLRTKGFASRTDLVEIRSE